MPYSDPASLSAQYLFWGAQSSFLGVEQLKGRYECLLIKGLARAVYSMGILIVGPAGVLYHLFSAFYIQVKYCKQSLKPLHEKKIQHLKAAYMDLISFKHGVLALIEIWLLFSLSYPNNMMMCFFVIPTCFPMPLREVPYPFRCLSNIPLHSIINPHSYSDLLDHVHRKLYEVVLKINLLRRLGYVEGHLNDDEIEKIAEIINKNNREVTWFDEHVFTERTSYDKYKLAIALLDKIRFFNKINPKKLKEVNELVRKANDIGKCAKDGYETVKHKQYYFVSVSEIEEETNKEFKININCLFNGNVPGLFKYI
jgi:hypothetical protein